MSSPVCAFRTLFCEDADFSLETILFLIHCLYNTESSSFSSGKCRSHWVVLQAVDGWCCILRVLLGSGKLGVTVLRKVGEEGKDAEVQKMQVGRSQGGCFWLEFPASASFPKLEQTWWKPGSVPSPQPGVEREGTGVGWISLCLFSVRISWRRAA